MYPQNPYSGPMPLPQPPPRKDPVRTGLVVALALLLVAAVVLTAVLLWPKGSTSGKRESAGSVSTSSQPSGSSSSAPASSENPQPSATSDQFSDPPPSTGVGAPASPSTTTTNGVSEQQRADACARATSGSVQKISRDTQWGIASGPDVTVLTTLLAFIGYDTAPTSTYTAQAEQAAMAFQQAHGLEADGIVGEVTWPVLAKEACTN